MTECGDQSILHHQMLGFCTALHRTCLHNMSPPALSYVLCVGRVGKQQLS